jgi:acyl dehydratase
VGTSSTTSGASVAFDDISVGDERHTEFPPLTRTMFVRYAGASGDFNPMHHDDTIATQVGNPSVFGHGMLTMGLAGRVLTDWFGPESIRRFQVRFAKQVWPGDVLTASATVSAVRSEGGATLADLDLVVTSDKGTEAVRGAATCVVPA